VIESASLSGCYIVLLGVVHSAFIFRGMWSK